MPPQQPTLRNHIRGTITRYTDRLFKMNTASLVAGGFWVTASQVAMAGFAFLGSVAFANLLAKDIYGSYRYILSLVGIIGCLSYAGIHTAIIHATSHGKDGLFRKSMALSIKSSWPMILVGLGISAYYFIRGDVQFGSAMAIATLLSPIVSAASLFRSFLSGRRLFEATFKYNAAISFVSTAAMISASFIGLNVLGLVATYFIANTIAMIVARRLAEHRYTPNSEYDQSSMSYTRHMSVLNILDTIATHIDKLLLFQMVGPVALATYSFATAIPEQMKVFFKNAGVVAMPNLAKVSSETIREKIFGKIFRLLLITTPIVILYILAAPYVFKIFFPDYIDAIKYSQAFGIALLVEGGIPAAVFKAKGDMKASYIQNISANVAKIGLLAILAPFFGIWGVVWARVIARYISFGISLLQLRKIGLPNTSA